MPVAQDRRATLTCFVSAATATDLRPVLLALESINVAVLTAQNIGPGEPITEAMIRAVLTADFVCVVIDEPIVNPNIAYEIGIAAGSRRPIVVASSASSDEADLSIFSELATIRYNRSTVGLKNLGEGLRAFVQNVQPAAVQIAIDWDAVGSASLPRTGLSAVRGDSLTKAVAQRLAAAGGYVVANSDDEHDIVADFPLLGAIGKIVVEVKFRYVNSTLHRRVETQLRRSMRQSGALLGMLVYGSPSDIRTRLVSEGRSQHLLFNEFDDGILVVSASELMDWTDNQLVAELTRLRNAVVHGKR